MSDLPSNDGNLDALKEKGKQDSDRDTHQESTKRNNEKSKEVPAVFRYDQDKKEIVRVDDANGPRDGVNTLSIAAYAKNVEEYKQIYKDMVLWDTVVKKREEEIEKGVYEKDCRASNAFLEDARSRYLKFKKMERNHILSGIIDERNIWEDSDDEDEPDEDSVECVGSGDELMKGNQEEESDDEELQSVECDPFSEDSDDTTEMNRKNKRKKQDEENDDKSISDDDTVIMGLVMF